MDSDMVMEYLLPILKELLSDDNDSVKISAVTASIPISEKVNDSQTILVNVVDIF